jgi:hypothetical protein
MMNKLLILVHHLRLVSSDSGSSLNSHLTTLLNSKVFFTEHDCLNGVVRSMGGTGIALIHKDKWSIAPADELVRVATGQGPSSFAILRDISAEGLLCGPRVLSASVFGVVGTRKFARINEMAVLQIAKDTVAKELERIDDLADQPTADDTTIRLRDALVAEVNEREDPTEPTLSNESSSSSASSPSSSLSLSSLSPLRQRAACLRDSRISSRLTHIEMMLGLQVYGKANGKIYRASTKKPARKWHVEFFPQSDFVREMPKSFYVYYEVQNNGAGHWRVLEFLQHDDVVIDADYNPVIITMAKPPAEPKRPASQHEPILIAPPIAKPQKPKTNEAVDEGKKDKPKPKDTSTNEESKKTVVTTGSIVSAPQLGPDDTIVTSKEGKWVGNGAALIIKDGSQTHYQSLVRDGDGFRLSLFSTCKQLPRPRQSSSATPATTCKIVGLSINPVKSSKTPLSVQIWVVPYDAKVMYNGDGKEEKVVDLTGGEGDHVDPSVVPKATLLSFSRLDVAGTLALASDVVTTERQNELKVMHLQWLQLQRQRERELILCSRASRLCFSTFNDLWFFYSEKTGRNSTKKVSDKKPVDRKSSRARKPTLIYQVNVVSFPLTPIIYSSRSFCSLTGSRCRKTRSR